jgi:hypothetical protein
MIWWNATIIYISGHRAREQSVATTRYGIFEQYIKAQQRYAWLLRHTLCSVEFQDGVDAIQEEKAIAISD